MGMDDQRGSLFGSPIHAGALDIFKEDVYGFGVILLPLVTGKLVNGNGQPYNFLLCWCDMKIAVQTEMELKMKITAIPLSCNIILGSVTPHCYLGLRIKIYTSILRHTLSSIHKSKYRHHWYWKNDHHLIQKIEAALYQSQPIYQCMNHWWETNLWKNSTGHLKIQWKKKVSEIFCK